MITVQLFLNFFFSALRNRGFRFRASSAAFPDLELQDKAGFFDSPELKSDLHLSFKRSYHGKHDSANFYMVRCGLSSQAGAKSSGEEDDLEDGFSELEKTDRANAAGDNDDDELISEPDFSDDDVEPSKDELEISDTETDLNQKTPSRKRVASALFNAIVAAPGLSVNNALDKWVEEGNEIDRGEVFLAMLNLRKLRMYGRALQVNCHNLIYTLG